MLSSTSPTGGPSYCRRNNSDKEKDHIKRPSDNTEEKNNSRFSAQVDSRRHVVMPSIPISDVKNSTPRSENSSAPKKLSGRLTSRKKSNKEEECIVSNPLGSQKNIIARLKMVGATYNDTIELDEKNLKCLFLDKKLKKELKKIVTDVQSIKMEDPDETSFFIIHSFTNNNKLQAFQSSVLIPKAVNHAKKLQDELYNFLKLQEKENTLNIKKKTPFFVRVENCFIDLLGKPEEPSETEFSCLGNFHHFTKLLSAKKGKGKTFNKLISSIKHLLPNAEFLKKWDIPMPAPLPYNEVSREGIAIANVCPMDVVRTIIPNKFIVPEIIINEKRISIDEINFSTVQEAQFYTIEKILSKIYEAGFSSECLKLYHVKEKEIEEKGHLLNLFIKEQTNILLHFADASIKNNKFRTKLDKLLNQEIIKWDKVENLFSKRLGCTTIQWDKIKKEEILLETMAGSKILKEITPGTITLRSLELLHQLIPPFSILQACSVSAFSGPRDAFCQNLKPLFEEKKLDLASLQGLDKERKNNTFIISIKENGYTITIPFQIGIFPFSISQDSWSLKDIRKIDFYSKLGTFNVDLILQAPNSAHLHKGDLICRNVELSPKTLSQEKLTHTIKFLTEMLPRKYEDRDEEFTPMVLTLSQTQQDEDQVQKL